MAAKQRAARYERTLRGFRTAYRVCFVDILLAEEGVEAGVET